MDTDPRALEMAGIDALHHAIEIFISFAFYSAGSYDDTMAKGISPIAEALHLDVVVIYTKVKTAAESFGQIYRWSRNAGGTSPLSELMKVLPPIPTVQKWFQELAAGECVFFRLDKATEDEKSFVDLFGIKSMAIVPIFTQGEFWGAVSFQDHSIYRDFGGYRNLLLSAARLFTSATIRYKMSQDAHKANEIFNRQKLFTNTSNKLNSMLISHLGGSYEERMTRGIELVADTVRLDRVSVWRNFAMGDGLHTGQVYRWDRASGGYTKPTQGLENLMYGKDLPNFEEILSNNKTLNGPVRFLPEIVLLSKLGVVSAFIMPLMLGEVFWGVILFEDRKYERYFESDEADIMCSTAFLCANTIIRSEMEQQVSDARDFAQVVTFETPVVYALYDKDLRIVECNDTAVRVFEYPDKQTLMNTPWKNLSPEFQPDGRNSLEEGYRIWDKLRVCKKMSFEWIHQTASGAPLPMEITLVGVENKGKPYIVSFKYDLRSAKEMEANIRKQSELLRIRLEQQEMIAELARGFVSLRSAEELINEALERLGRHNNSSIAVIFHTDYEKQESNLAYTWIDRNDRFNFSHYDIFDLMLSRYPERVPNRFVSTVVACSDIAASPEEDLHLLLRYNVNAFITAPLYVEDHLWGIVVIASRTSRHDWSKSDEDFLILATNIIASVISRDIYENKFHNTLHDLTIANRAKDDFLSKLSHEIRTPLNAILGITEIQLRDEAISNDLKKGLKTIHYSGDLLFRMINDILDLSKIKAGKIEILPVRYGVASLINDTVHLNALSIGSRPIEFRLQIAEDIPAYLIGDELRIKQILNNVLSNAFKYTERGEISFSISAGYETLQKDAMVTLICQISDTGLGMAHEDLAQLFDDYTRFYTGLNRTVEGIGLGMPITKKLVETMGGSISVESVKNQGSSFVIRLPQLASGSEVIGREISENLQRFHFEGVKDKRIDYEYMPYGSILIVDDLETNLYVTKGLLSPYGLAVDTAMSGQEAIGRIRSGSRYDVILMDYMMPEMDGIETTKQLRALGYAQPIVAFTADAVVGRADVFLANGFNAFISKPIDMHQLNSLLNTLIRDKQPPEILEAARQEALQSGRQASGSASSYIDPQLREIFVRDSTKAVCTLRDILENLGEPSKEDVRLFTITAHSMKSALLNVGEPELSVEALQLENAGRAADIVTIGAKTPGFIKELQAVIERVKPSEREEEVQNTGEEIFALQKELALIREACLAYDSKTAREVLAGIRQKKWARITRDSLAAVAEYILHSDFEEAVTAIDSLCQGVQTE
ncbi:MAG: GAF domain-containing protein [Spirochaetota bacterium]|nr:GAF domain-containing protein [Spirochaetota bacterium]